MGQFFAHRLYCMAQRLQTHCALICHFNLLTRLKEIKNYQTENLNFRPKKKERTLIELKSNRCNDLNCSTIKVRCSEVNPFHPASERPTKFGQELAKMHKTQSMFVTFQLAVMVKKIDFR